MEYWNCLRTRILTGLQFLTWQLKPIGLQRLGDVIAPVLKVIYQTSLYTGRMPRDWSTAYVCPLFKKGDTSLASSYRLISLTSILLEHIVTTNVVSHTDHYNLLYDLQHGPRWACCDYQQTSSVTKMLETLHWRPLDQRRIDSGLVIMY